MSARDSQTRDTLLNVADASVLCAYKRRLGAPRGVDQPRGLGTRRKPHSPHSTRHTLPLGFEPPRPKGLQNHSIKQIRAFRPFNTKGDNR